MKIDSHQHFWTYSVAEYGWITEAMHLLKKDHLPESLLRILSKNGIDGSIAVQARQTVEETRWLLQLSERYSFIKGVVGWVDLQSEKLDDQLKEFAAFPNFVGVRHVVQDEPDDDFLLRERFLQGINKLLEYNLTYDILIYPHHLPIAAEFIKCFPSHRLILDHIAKPNIKDRRIRQWEKNLQALSEYPHVYCKVSGLVTEADWHSWTYQNFEPYLDVIFELFGINRLLFGSDWPVCTVAGSYKEIMSIVEKYLDNKKFSDNECSGFWGENAAKIYNLKL